MQQIVDKDKEAAVGIVRDYVKKMLGHPYFEIQTIDTKREGGLLLVQFEVVHLIRSERIRYEMKIKLDDGSIETVKRLEFE